MVIILGVLAKLIFVVCLLVNYPFFQALGQVAKLKQDLEHLRGGPFLHCLQKVSELETLPITVLKQIQQQMRVDLETIEKVSLYNVTRSSAV